VTSKVWNNNAIYGAIVARDVTFSGSAPVVHYDVKPPQCRVRGIDTPYAVTNVRDTTTPERAEDASRRVDCRTDLTAPPRFIVVFAAHACRHGRPFLSQPQSPRWYFSSTRPTTACSLRASGGWMNGRSWSMPFAELPAPVDDESDRAVDRSDVSGSRRRLHGLLLRLPSGRPLASFARPSNTKRFAEPNYLATLLAETTKIPAIKDWHLAALSATDGEILSTATPSRPGLLFGMPQTTAREFQRRLRKLRLRPRRLEAGTLAHARRAHALSARDGVSHAVVACEITYTNTRIYFLGKDGRAHPARAPARTALPLKKPR